MSFIGELVPSKPIRVYGAGISGLITAYYAKKAGYKVELHENSSQTGGLIQLHKLQQGYVDSAAHTILINEEIKTLFNELSLTPQYFPAKTKRFLVKEGIEFDSYPVGLKEFPQLLAKGFIKIPSSALKENASVADFFIPWIGKNLVDQVVSTALSGIYASYSDELHFRSIFEAPIEGDRYLTWAKRVIKKMRSNKLSSTSFANGMAELPIAITKSLEGVIQFNSSPELDDSYNNIICTNAHDAADICPELLTVLNQIKYKSVFKTTFFLDKKIPQLDGAFGALLSQQSDFKSMGIINTSHLFPARTLGQKLYQYSIIHNDEADIEHDLNLLKMEMPLIKKTFKWNKGIPIYSPEREEIIKALTLRPGLLVMGNYTGDISLRKIILNAKSFFNDPEV